MNPLLAFAVGMACGVVVIVAVLAAVGPCDDDRHATVRPASTATPTAPTTTTTSGPATNVYRDADGFCFGASPSAAAAKGLQPAPECAP